jgi:hypothetical protein
MRIKRIIFIGLACLFLCAVSALGVLRWTIQSGLDERCDIAQSKYPHPGDDVAAMLEYVQSNSNTLIDRNSVVWALGQARDSRALPVLERFYTGKKCNHRLYLCQSELKKAIELCKGGTLNLLVIKTP